MVFLISYDINESLYDYTELKESIKALGDFQHPMESLWFVDSQIEDVNVVVERLKGAFRSANDHIFVLKLSDPSINRQGWMPRSFWGWLTEHLSND